MRAKRLSAFFLALFLTVSLALSICVPAQAIEKMEVAARAALLLDPDTGEVLHTQNIHDRLPPASLTKIMTALLVLEAVDDGRLALDTVLTASASAIDAVPPEGSNAAIKAGDAHTVDTLLKCAMVASANEACNILAEALDGSIEGFVARMNAKAEDLGCTNTHFVTTNGLPDEDHYTTAWDLYLIIQEAMEHEDFMPLCDTRHFTKPATDQSPARTYYTTNLLLSPYRAAGYVYSAAHGIKTGYTSKAGNCLASTATKGGRSLLGIVLGAETVKLENGGSQNQSFTEMVRLFEWGFQSFSRQTLLTGRELLQEVKVELSEVGQVVVKPERGVERLLPVDLPPEEVEREIVIYQEPIDAPVSEGDVLGELTLRDGDTIYATVPLLANSSVEASRLLVFRRQALAFLSQKKVWYIAGAAAAAIVILSVGIHLWTKCRRQNRHNKHTYNAYSGSNYRGRRR